MTAPAPQDSDPASSEAAFEAFCRDTLPEMLAYARHRWPDARAVAEEAVIETYIKLKGRWGRVSTHESPERWVHKVLENCVRDALRRDGCARTLRLAPPVPSDVVETVYVREVLAAMSRLSERQRDVMVLCCLQGLAQNEVAQQLGIRPPAVSRALDRGRKKLRKVLGLATDGHEDGVPLLSEARRPHGASVDQLTFTLRRSLNMLAAAYAGDEEWIERTLATILDSGRPDEGEGPCE